MSQPALLFDLDNTLLECGQYYIDAQKRVVDLIHSATNLPKTFINSVVESIDVASSALPDGFSRSRLPRSYQAASLALDAVAGIPPSVLRSVAAYEIGDSVFSAPYPLYPGTVPVLEAYSKHYRLILVTKGDEEVQRRKIAINNLDRFFKPDHTFITLKKSPALYASILERFDLDPHTTWMIGDSLRDDIGPASEVGMRTVEMRTSTGRWGYENQNHVADRVITDLRELTKFIPTTLPHEQPKHSHRSSASRPTSAV